ncbi:CDP-diacylglycerol-inositol 3-phosphatidyltransferase [Babesia gibsoni]|uniref:CDP-diacylglycerol--inositol 3-phosphatidyltransferase n=1 Tax=Babesia gibsoni TaxID=33632 RepID=A0AAD8LT42_BABGI|nr:CDP-diacylglycerol-inositol 3-phosphatidyltransferase [Babesia gibsoni]
MAKAVRTPTLFTYANGVTTIRVILFVYGLQFTTSDVKRFLAFYTAAYCLDGVDGFVSRFLNESSVIGAAYDQLVDRMCTNFLCYLNALRYPDQLKVFYLVMALDICGHWIHNYACALHQETNHKKMGNVNFLLKIYYESRVLMTLCIIMYEGFFGALYARTFVKPKDPMFLQLTNLLYVTAPLCFYKILTNVLQGILGVSRVLEYDRKVKY